MVDQIRKPGVNITQVVGGTPPTPVTATLVPCIVGPAFEVVELIGEDGTASAESQVNTSAGPLLYKQLPIELDVSDYPTPRADSNQMSVLVPEVEVALQRTGDFNILDRNPGTAFLNSVNYGTRPGIFITTQHLVDNCLQATFIVLVDTALNNNPASFVVNNAVVASGTDSDDAEALLDNIVGTVSGTAYVNATVNATDGYVLYSTRYGADASINLVSVSGGATATMFAGLQYNGGTLDKIRVEGGGFYAEDNVNATILTSSIVKFTPGLGQVEDGTNGLDDDISQAENLTIGNGAFIGVQVNIFGEVDPDYMNNDVDFNDLQLVAATPTSDGDLFTAGGPYGQSISNVMVTEIQPEYIKLGVVNTQRSVYDADGNPQHQVYTDFQLGTLNNPVPFAPKNGYFIAQNLTEFSDGIVGTAQPAKYVGEAVACVIATGAQVQLKGWTPGIQVGMAGYAFQLRLTIDGTTEVFRLPFLSADENANIALWNTNFLNGKVTVSYADPYFTFTSVETGSNVTLEISGSPGEDAIAELISSDVTFGAYGTTGGLHQQNNGAKATDFGSDDMLAGFTGKKLVFSLNDCPTEYSFVASSEGIQAFVTTVNDRMGYEALTFDVDTVNDEVTFTLTSYLFGIASKISTVLGELGTQALGFATVAGAFAGIDGNTAAPLTGYPVGVGRPNPDVFVHEDGSLVISGDIMRNTITGFPVDTSTSARVHLAYRALRLDLTPTANAPGIIRVSSIDTLQEVFGPISNRNPFALALYFALLNSGDGVEINAIAVDDVSEAEPDGTVIAYASAAEFLRSYEVYSIVPLTHDENVIALFDNHVKDMSEPQLRAERTVISAPSNPERYNDFVVLSTGEDGAESTGIVNQVDLNDSPEAVLNGLGIDTSQAIPFQFGDLRQLYLHITVGDASYKYSVSTISGGRVSFRTTYTSSQNGDGFYSTSALPNQFASAEFSLALRGAPLTIAGTGLLNKTAYAETIRNGAQQYLNRRQIRLYPDTVQSDAVGGINQRLPSYYFAAALAGMVGNIESQEPLTRVPMVGFNDVIGPALDRNHLNVISAGNAVIEPESEGANPSLRMQGSTDPSSIESREWSVTRAVDAFSKTLRNQLKSKIGRFNITQAYIDDLTMLVDSNCTAAVDQGQFRGADVIKLEQDVSQPDTILVEIQLEVLYPANYINVTLVV